MDELGLYYALTSLLSLFVFPCRREVSKRVLLNLHPSHMYKCCHNYLKNSYLNSISRLDCVVPQRLRKPFFDLTLDLLMYVSYFLTVIVKNVQLLLVAHSFTAGDSVGQCM